MECGIQIMPEKTFPWIEAIKNSRRFIMADHKNPSACAEIPAIKFLEAKEMVSKAYHREITDRPSVHSMRWIRAKTRN